jgi:hypothetical protein
MPTENQKPAGSLLCAPLEPPALLSVAPDYTYLEHRIRAAQALELSILFAEDQELQREFLQLAAEMGAQADKAARESHWATGRQPALGSEEAPEIQIEMALSLP